MPGPGGTDAPGEATAGDGLSATAPEGHGEAGPLEASTDGFGVAKVQPGPSFDAQALTSRAPATTVRAIRT